MVKVNTDVNGNPLPCEIYLDGKMKQNFDFYNKKRNLNWDVVGAVVGLEGDGKTVMTLQYALYMDYKFNINHIVFTEEQFYEAVDDEQKFPDGSCLVWDEADAAAEHFASTIIRAMTKKFKRIRKRRLVIFLVTPTFFDMNRYFAVHRLRFLIEVYSNGLERGFFNYFNIVQKRLLYFEGKKYWNMGAANASSYGRFTDLPKGFPVDMSKGSEYDKKKDEATKEISGDENGIKLPAKEKKALELAMRKALVNRMVEDGISQRQIAKWFGVNKNVINECVTRKEPSKFDNTTIKVLMPNKVSNGEDQANYGIDLLKVNEKRKDMNSS